MLVQVPACSMLTFWPSWHVTILSADAFESWSSGRGSLYWTFPAVPRNSGVLCAMGSAFAAERPEALGDEGVQGTP